MTETKEEHAKRVFGDLSTSWDFKSKEDKKKVWWWNPLDWIPKFYTVRNAN